MTLTIDRPATEPAPATATETGTPTAGLTILLAHGDLESVWASLILATAGAAMGKKVTVFFTFWGLFPLVRNDRRVMGSHWMQKMMSAMNRGGASHLPLSKYNFLGAGPLMMRHLAKKVSFSSPEELLDIARELEVELVPCQMTMDLMGLTKADLIDGVGEPAGAATALAAADTGTTLFI
jgi:peroxiredoxin family protein